MNHVTHHLSSSDISIFAPEISKFCYTKKYRYINKNKYINTDMQIAFRCIINKNKYINTDMQIAFRCTISNSFNFSWVFKDFFNKNGYNFDDVSKNGYPRPS